MAHEAGGFIDDEQAGVFVDDFEKLVHFEKIKRHKAAIGGSGFLPLVTELELMPDAGYEMVSRHCCIGEPTDATSSFPSLQYSIFISKNYLYLSTV
jgi:hypothetical protein